MIKVLLIEDNSADASRIQTALAAAGDGVFLDSFEFVVAESLGIGLDVLKKDAIDVVLLDLGLPDTRDFDGVDRLRKDFPVVPIVVLTKQREDTLVAVEAVKRGAQDYFSKANLSDGFSLDRIIRYALERKKHEQEIISAREEAVKAKDEALRASKAKSDFLANMSHDIRTPLNCIIGVADLLSRAKLSEEEINYVQMLNKASDNLLALINDVLDLSKIESGLIKINRESFDLLDMVEKVLDFTAARAHGKGLEVIFKIEPDVPRLVIGDPEHVSQILINLLGNAIKFTKVGEITVVVSKGDSQALAELKMSAKTAVKFSVKDTGIGIPSDKLSVVFDSFTQLDQKDASLKRQGTGLGLSICKRLVELMEGRIEVSSEFGKGSLFQFQLPFELPVKACAGLVIPLLDLTHSSVLVVDDNQAHGLFLKELLVYWGASVQLTRTAQEAEAFIRECRTKQKKFDLALLDVRMPGVATGGIELAEKIKNDVKASVLMLPVNHRYGDIERLKQAGISKYYFKPTKPDQLAQLISEILSKDLSTAGQPIAAESQNISKELRLLVVDDSEENRQLFVAYCKGTNLRLELAEDGLQAFDKFKREAFDLVLMDLQMPKMDGYEALAAIRRWEEEQKRQNKVPILALTAFAMKEEAQKCLSAGFRAHITKPIRKNDLLNAIKKYSV